MAWPLSQARTSGLSGHHHYPMLIVSGCEVGAVFSEVDCVESAQSPGQLKAQEKPSERAAAVHRLDHRSTAC